jgi:sugar O-acyltransferase (sialic acid O-acetyltransferase NeuD family)
MSDATARELVVFGASGHGAAISCMLARIGPAPPWRTVAFIDDTPSKHGTKLLGVPVVSYERWLAELRSRPCFVAVGNTVSRANIVERLTGGGASFLHVPAAEPDQHGPVNIGAGSLVCPPAFVGPAVSIGRHVQVMPMVSLGHDIQIGSFVTICPGATISGHVVIEDGAFLGAGCVVVNGNAQKPIVVGAWSTVYAGAVVTKSVPTRAKVAGNPARALRALAGQNGG